MKRTEPDGTGADGTGRQRTGMRMKGAGFFRPCRIRERCTALSPSILLHLSRPVASKPRESERSSARRMGAGFMGPHLCSEEPREVRILARRRGLLRQLQLEKWRNVTS
jgi:hypothetical protein